MDFRSFGLIVGLVYLAIPLLIGFVLVYWAVRLPSGTLVIDDASGEILACTGDSRLSAPKPMTRDIR